MSDSKTRQLLLAVQPVARANSEIVAIVKGLVERAQHVADPEARMAILRAADGLLNETDKIIDALNKVGEAR